MAISSFEWAEILRTMNKQSGKTITVAEAIDLYNTHPEVTAHGGTSSKDCHAVADDDTDGENNMDDNGDGSDGSDDDDDDDDDDSDDGGGGGGGDSSHDSLRWLSLVLME